MFALLDVKRKMSTKIKMADRLKGTERNVWVEFGKLAADYKAINLGQGFPDYHPPQHVLDEFAKTITSSENSLFHQYTRSYGHPHLVKTLAQLYSPIMGRQIDAMSEVMVSVGAFGILFSTIQGLVNPGDEVIIIEPYFDCYEPMVKVAGGTPVFIPLRPSKTEGTVTSHDWKLDKEELASKFSSKTKAIVFNNPNNPVGKVYKMDEVEMIADLCKKHDAVCIADEVYEWMIYSDNKHIKIATLPGMWERTITIGSAGKTFSATGWKLGWGIGPSELIQALSVLHQNSIYTCPTPIQEAVASGLDYEISVFGDQEKCYLQSLALELLPKRDMLAKVLAEVGITPTIPEGGYFMMADISKLDVEIPDDGTDDPYDFKFIRWMCKEKKLSAIPPTAFYSQGDKKLGEKFIRFCFIKNDETLEAASKVLRSWNVAVKK
ncbi:kynurenine--oxoglutarate transaminase 3-like isoform X2 [Mercenaria mercenaria]|uniref:kynurenine--oxoglutarate transaminase 3-like isoform X2 n=1 Tax=Mercenaria mercenaria TaxID=6596 RepID=UPI00234F3116|nr:kynurenine--oxoglutarate transaminase 3-like isoform X2 [Mercenaria mercenaria]